MSIHRSSQDRQFGSLGREKKFETLGFRQGQRLSTPHSSSSSQHQQTTPRAPSTKLNKNELRMRNFERPRIPVNVVDENEFVSDEEFKMEDSHDGVVESDGSDEEFVNEKRSFSSDRGKWNPSSLMRNCCFDDNGILLSKADCQRNLKNAMKSKKGVDFYDILKFSNNRQTLGLSFALFMIDSFSKKMPRGLIEKEVTPDVIFDLQAAQEADMEEILPGAKRVLISDLIIPAMCTNWTGKSAVVKSVVSILDQIRIRDPWFLYYSAPDSDRATTYPNIGLKFFSTFANVLKAGFHFPDESSSVISLAAHIRCTTRNFIEKRRRLLRLGMQNLLGEFNHQLSMNPNFRSKEPRVNDQDIAGLELPLRKVRKAINIPNERESDFVMVENEERALAEENYDSDAVSNHSSHVPETNEVKKSVKKRATKVKEPGEFKTTIRSRRDNAGRMANRLRF